MKTIRTLFFCFLAVLGSLWSVTAQEEKTLTMEILHQRMWEVAQRYPAGSFFTDNGQACTHHYLCNQIGNCNCKVVTEAEAGTAGNMQCFGFARFVFYRLFGKPYPHFNSRCPWQVSQSEEAANVVCVFSQAPGMPSEPSAVKELLSSCLFGDVLQTGLPHSMIVTGREEEGIWVYDANFDMVTCGVQVHFLTWEDLSRSLNSYGMSLYRSVNYPSVRQSPRMECVLLPREGLRTDAVPVGLTFTYEKKDLFYVVTCTEDGTYRIHDGVRSFAANDQKHPLKVTVTAGTAFDKGTLAVEFLDGTLQSTEEVDAPESGLLSFVPPSRTEYQVGESLCVEDVCAYVALADGQRRFFFSDELTFSGFDSTRAGECTVTVKGEGWDTSFSVFVTEEASPEPSDSPFGGRQTLLWWGLGMGAALLLSAGSVSLYLFWLKRGEKKEEKAEENQKTT